MLSWKFGKFIHFYGWFSSDVIAAMLMHRAKQKIRFQRRTPPPKKKNNNNNNNNNNNSKTRKEKSVPLASSFPDQRKTVPDFYGHRNSPAARKVIRNGFYNKSCNAFKTISTINVFLSSQPNANEKVEKDYLTTALTRSSRLFQAISVS